MNEDVQKLDNELFGTDRSDAHGETTLLKQYEIFVGTSEALGEGEDKKKYIPFTRAEKVTPIVFLLVQFAVIGAGLYTFAQ